MLSIATPTCAHTYTQSITFVDTELCVLEENERKNLSPSSLSTVKTTPRPRAANKGGMRQRGAPVLPFLPLFLSNWLSWSCHGPNAIQPWLAGPQKARQRNKEMVFSLCLQGTFERRDSVKQGQPVQFEAGLRCLLQHWWTQTLLSRRKKQKQTHTWNKMHSGLRNHELRYIYICICVYI